MTRRLLLVSDSLSGGLGAAVGRQAAWFAARGWDVLVAAPSDGPAPPTVDVAPLATPRTLRDVPAMGRLVGDLRRAVARFGPDVVHCHGVRSFLATRPVSRRAPFVTLHGAGAVPTDPRGYAALRRIGLRAVPRLSAGAVTAAPDVPGRWRFLVHASPRLDSLGRLPFPPPEGVPTFLWVGRLDPGKPGDTFVRAVAELASRTPVRGVVAGTGPLEDDLRRLVGRLGAPVDLVGQADPEPLLADAWALGLFSVQEAVPFVVQEAMWAGRAVVATPLPGIRWAAGETLVPASTVADAVAGFARLCDHATAVERGEAAARRIRTLVRPGDPWPAIEEHYLRALGATPVP